MALFPQLSLLRHLYISIHRKNMQWFFCHTLQSIEFGLVDLVSQMLHLQIKRLDKFLLPNNLYLVHCLSHRTLLYGHHLNMKILSLQCMLQTLSHRALYLCLTLNYPLIFLKLTPTVLPLSPDKSDLD